MGSITRADVEQHLERYLETTARWQLGPEAGRLAGGLACPVSRVPMQWTEFFTLPVAVEAWARTGDAALERLCRGLVAYLARVQRADGTLDAGFCGDVAQPCNAAFALRPLATALRAWPGDRDAPGREALEGVVRRAADACVDGGMTTPNHRWVAAAGLAHAARALEAQRLADAADEWTRAAIDIRADGSYSEGSPNYALVSNDCFLDLEELQGRSDLGDLARRSLGYLRSVQMPDGAFAAVASVRYDTDGSSDCYARAASVFARLGAHGSASRALGKLWSVRTAPGLLAANVLPPLAVAPKAKQYASVDSAIAAENLQRWLRFGRDASSHEESGEPGGSGQEGRSAVLGAVGILRYTAGRFAVAASPTGNLFEVQYGSAVLEGARLMAHATGWNALYAVEHKLEGGGMRLRMTTAPGSSEIRLPQYHRTTPEERRPGNAVPPVEAELALRCGPGGSLRLEVRLDGPEGVNAMLELAARADQALFDADGIPLSPPWAAPPAGLCVVAGRGAERLAIEHRGGSGHALQVDRYGYGVGDALWAPSFRPHPIRIGLEVPARLELTLRAM